MMLLLLSANKITFALKSSNYVAYFITTVSISVEHHGWWVGGPLISLNHNIANGGGKRGKMLCVFFLN